MRLSTFNLITVARENWDSGQFRTIGERREYRRRLANTVRSYRRLYGRQTAIVNWSGLEMDSIKRMRGFTV